MKIWSKIISDLYIDGEIKSNQLNNAVRKHILVNDHHPNEIYRNFQYMIDLALMASRIENLDTVRIAILEVQHVSIYFTLYICVLYSNKIKILIFQLCWNK